MKSYENFIEARNLLLDVEDYGEAKKEFLWPNIVEFNWATDYFDKMADEESNPAILYVDDYGVKKVLASKN